MRDFLKILYKQQIYNEANSASSIIQIMDVLS